MQQLKKQINKNNIHFKTWAKNKKGAAEKKTFIDTFTSTQKEITGHTAINCKGCAVIPYHDILLTRKLPKTNYNIKKRKSDQANYPDVKTEKKHPRPQQRLHTKCNKSTTPRTLKKIPRQLHPKY